LVFRGTVYHPVGYFSSRYWTSFKSCILLPAFIDIFEGVYDSSDLKSKNMHSYCTLVFFMNCMLIRWGWEPSDCQKVLVLSSRNCSTPFPILADERVQTASLPIYLRVWLLTGGVVEWLYTEYLILYPVPYKEFK
jgi:hypothetical protein